MKAIILARVSTEDQLTEGHSIPAQLEKAREYVHRKGFEIKSEHQFDESSIKDQRTKFELVIEEIKQCDEKIALIVETIDRLQRSFKESVLLDGFRKQGKLEIHFIRENLVIHKDSNSSEIQRWDLGVFLAKSYVLQISDNVKRSIDHKLKNGERPGKAPFGYVNTRSEDGKCWIEPHPYKSKVVRRIFEWYATGAFSMEQISKKVKEEFSLTFPKGRVDFVLKEPFYCGLNRHKDKLYPHKYQTIISKELFDKVQDIKASFHKKPFKFGGLPYLYRGLIRCEKCGCSYTPEKKKGKYVYYHCTEYHGKCNSKWFREEELTKQFAGYIDKIYIPDDIVESIGNFLKESHKGKIEHYEAVSKELNTQYNLLQNRIEKMYEDKLDGSITEDSYNKLLLKYRAEQSNIQTRLKNLQEVDKDYYLTGIYLLKLANKAPTIFKSSEPEVKRQLIKLVVQNPTINDATLNATIRKPFSLWAKGLPRSNWLPREDSNLGHGGYT
jgi:DNA invertase Pin-like site-specific DNA recombinase